MSDLTFGLVCIHLGGCLGAIIAAKWRIVPFLRAIILAALLMGTSVLSPWPLGFRADVLWDDFAGGIAVGAVLALIAGRLMTVPLASIAAIMTFCVGGMVIGALCARWVLF